MRLVPFTGCCGAYIIWDLGGTKITPGSEGAIPKKQLNDKLTDWTHQYSRRGMLIVILNPDQKRKFAPTLEKYEFQCVAEGYNVNHSHNIYMYVRTGNRENRGKARKRYQALQKKRREEMVARMKKRQEKLKAMKKASGPARDERGRFVKKVTANTIQTETKIPQAIRSNFTTRYNFTTTSRRR